MKPTSRDCVDQCNGDGIVLRDSCNGSEPLKVIDIGSDTAAKGPSLDGRLGPTQPSMVHGLRCLMVAKLTPSNSLRRDSLQEIVTRINDKLGSLQPGS